MRKLLLGAAALFLMVSCGGNGDKQAEENNKVQKFAEKFAGYVNANQMDSIKAVYPTANFDSVASLGNDSISISEIGPDSFKVNFTPAKWIDVKIGADGKMTVVNSKGIACFPEDKYQTAMTTGMLNDSTDDVKANELLKDDAYFEWLKKNSEKKSDYIIKISPGKYKNIWKPQWGEGSKGSITVTLTNLSDQAISGSDYSITYKTYESNGYTDSSRRNYTKNNTHKGIDLGPNKSGTITLSEWETYKFYDFKIKPAAGKEERLKFKPTEGGNEYQEYLKSKK